MLQTTFSIDSCVWTFKMGIWNKVTLHGSICIFGMVKECTRTHRCLDVNQIIGKISDILERAMQVELNI